MPMAATQERTFNSSEEDILSFIDDAPSKPAAPEGAGGEDQDQEVHDNVQKEEVEQPKEGDQDDPTNEGEPKPVAKPSDKQSGGKEAGKGDLKKPAPPTADAQTLHSVRSYSKRLERDNKQLTTDLTETRKQLNTLQTTFGAINGYGLSPDELNEGARLISLYKKDPVQAITEILQASREAGIDLRRINYQGIDTNAIKSMIQKEVGSRIDPLVAKDQELQAQEADKIAAETELNDFLDMNPEAETHLEGIVTVMKQMPGLGIAGAWDKLQIWAYRNGVDLFSPTPQAQPKESSGASANRKPLPAGGRRIAGSGTGEGVSTSTRTIAPAKSGQSLDEIISDAMAEAGFNYRR